MGVGFTLFTFFSVRSNLLAFFLASLDSGIKSRGVAHPCSSSRMSCP
jgi:hypothetical protein